jgi:hypothetical protein
MTEKINGVSTLSTACYSSTCTGKHLCYSITCPYRQKLEYVEPPNHSLLLTLPRELRDQIIEEVLQDHVLEASRLITRKIVDTTASFTPHPTALLYTNQQLRRETCQNLVRLQHTPVLILRGCSRDGFWGIWMIPFVRQAGDARHDTVHTTVQDIRSKPIVHPDVSAAPIAIPAKRTEKKTQHKGYRKVTRPHSLRNPILSTLTRIVAKITKDGTLPLTRLYIDVENVFDERSKVTYIEFCLYDRIEKELKRILPPRDIIYEKAQRDTTTAEKTARGERPVDMSHVHPSERCWGAVRCVQVMSEGGLRGFLVSLHEPYPRRSNAISKKG